MVDVNEPVTNPALVQAIESFQKDQTPENERLMIGQLKQARFLMVFEGELHPDAPDTDGKITIQQGSTLHFPMLSDSNGNAVHFAFTDWPALYKWKSEPNQQTLIMPFSDLPDMVLSEKVKSAGIVINPGNHNLFIDRQRLASISGRIDPYTVEKSTKVLLGEPSHYPHEMINAVMSAIQPMREVKKAWLLLMQKDDEQSYLIVIDFKGDRSKVSNTIGQAAMPFLKDMFVDIVPADSEFGKDAIKNRKPFYQRSFWG